MERIYRELEDDRQIQQPLLINEPPQVKVFFLLVFSVVKFPAMLFSIKEV
jgi:hypothetical protein